MTREDFAVFDTDMQIHRLSEEPRVGAEAERLRTERKPVRVVAFSNVEFKNAYIQRLVLLQNKVRDSDSHQELFTRVKNSGGRRTQMMLAQLIRFLGREMLSTDWTEAQAVLLTYLDAQIGESWRWFTASVDGHVDAAKCTRATEAPARVGSGWDVAIPDCNQKNTRCRVSRFLLSNVATLQRVVDAIDALPAGERTPELQRIATVFRSVVETGKYPWEGNTCRQIGDLLIGIEAQNCRLFVTSNAKEHVTLSQAIGYPLEVFKHAPLRLK